MNMFHNVVQCREYGLNFHQNAPKEAQPWGQNKGCLCEFEVGKECMCYIARLFINGTYSYIVALYSQIIDIYIYSSEYLSRQ